MHSRSDAGTSPHAGPDRHASAKTAVAPMLRDFAAPAHAFIVESLRRLTDYQDAAYAGLYLERLRPIARLDTPDGRLTAETARYLALWMCFEDLIRVADLKTRASRMQRVRAEVGAAPDEPLHIIEFLKPGLDEICGMLTPGLGRRLHAWALRRGLEHKLSPGLHLKTSSVFGFLLLRATASLRFWRRHSARYAEEQQLIERWLAAVLLAAGRSPELACEIALTARLIKGYGDTNMRGKASFKRILDHLVEGPAVSGDQARAQAIGQAREAALADAQGRGLDQVLGRHGIAPQPLRAVPIRFMKDAAGTRKQPRG